MSPPKSTPRKKIEIELSLDVENADPPLRSSFFVEISVLDFELEVLLPVEINSLDLS